MDGTTVGISQISSMDEEELQDLKTRMAPFLETMRSKHSVDMLFFMLTSILEESTEVLCDSVNGEQIWNRRFRDAGPRIRQCRCRGSYPGKSSLFPH